MGNPRPMSAHDAIDRLREGNRRFATGELSDEMRPSHSRIAASGGQTPFAIILGCSDSRVPAELVFGQGVGDLFVIRVAGNIVAPSLVGSVEFAAASFGTRLVVVLGHSNCGAILATLDEIQQPAESQSPNLRSIVDRVRPSVEGLLETEFRDDRKALVRLSVRANVRASVELLQHGSEILENLILAEDLRVVGAEYSLETGIVEFFDDEGG